MSKVLNEIDLSSKVKNTPFYIALFLFVVAFVLFMITKQIPGLVVVVLILNIVNGILYQNIKVFRFFEKHFSYQLGVFGKKNILYSDLESWSIEKEKKLIIKYNEQGKEKTRKIPLRSIDSAQISLLKDILDSKIQK